LPTEDTLTVSCIRNWVLNMLAILNRIIGILNLMTTLFTIDLDLEKIFWFKWAMIPQKQNTKLCKKEVILEYMILEA